MLAINIPDGAKLENNISFIDILGVVVIWAVLSLVTFGLALIILPYYYNKFVINQTYIVDQDSKKIAKLQNNLSFVEILGHAILWVVIIFITFGFGLFFYYYKRQIFIFNKTVVQALVV